MIPRLFVALGLAFLPSGILAGSAQKPNIELPNSAAANKAAVVDIFTKSYEGYRWGFGINERAWSILMKQILWLGSLLSGTIVFCLWVNHLPTIEMVGVRLSSLPFWPMISGDGSRCFDCRWHEHYGMFIMFSGWHSYRSHITFSNRQSWDLMLVLMAPLNQCRLLTRTSFQGFSWGSCRIFKQNWL